MLAIAEWKPHILYDVMCAVVLIMILAVTGLPSTKVKEHANPMVN